MFRERSTLANTSILIPLLTTIVKQTILNGLKFHLQFAIAKQEAKQVIVYIAWKPCYA